jgi:hypothetical protein
MADLSKDAYIQIMGEKFAVSAWVLDTSAAQHVYKGQPLLLNTSQDAENLVLFVTAVTVAPTDVFAGICNEEKVVASADPETTPVEVIVGPTIVGFKDATLTNADIGKTIYMSDSATLSETAADNPQIGKLVLVKDGFAYVQLSAPQICAGA